MKDDGEGLWKVWKELIEKKKLAGRISSNHRLTAVHPEQSVCNYPCAICKYAILNSCEKLLFV